MRFIALKFSPIDVGSIKICLQNIQTFQIEYNTDSVEPVENLVAESHLEQGELNALNWR